MDWKEKHRKFYYELDEYSKRELGFEAHQAFIQSLLEDLAKEMIGEEEKLPQDVDDGYAPAEYEDIIIEGRKSKRQEIITTASKWGIIIK